MSNSTNFDELLKLARGTRLESYANDEEKLKAFLIKEMQASTDPVTREIGDGIAGGSMTWRTVAASGAYREYIERGARTMSELDLGATFESVKSEQEHRPGQPRAADDDEDDYFSRPVLRRRR
jgi:hypothetical protein